MASDDVNIAEDSDMGECDGDKVVTMMDVLQEQQDFEEDANAVLGASDDKNCTYSKGYIKRQALYACLTCCTEAKTDPIKRAGVCLACSLMCHENHELIELYTKRNFRCDCGNPKFNSHPCTFTQDKTDLNNENIYNQNFAGLYCTCQRPYPDPENTFDEDMIQCIICEDWLHASHLDATVPTTDYAEMICKGCMEKNDFLHDYSNLAVTTETGNVDIVTINGHSAEKETEKVVNGTKGNEVQPVDIQVNRDAEMIEEKDKNENETVLNTEENKVIENNATDSCEVEKPSNTTSTEELAKKDEAIAANDQTDTNTNDNEDIKSNDTMENQNKNVEPSPNDNKEQLNANTDETSQKNDIPPTIDENKDVTKPDSKDYIDDKEVPKDTTNEQTEISGHLDVPDTSQAGTDKDHTADSVMNAIDEILETTDKSQVSETIDKLNDTTENKALEKDEIKGSDDNIDEVPEKSTIKLTKLNDNTCDTDIEMSAGNHGKTPESNQKLNDESTVNSDTIASDETTSKNEINSESPKKNIETPDNSDTGGENADKQNENIDKAINENTHEHKRKLSADLSEDISIKKAKFECVRPKGVKQTFKGATFWPSNFRQKLCTCGECISMYKDLKVLFLTDPEDTVYAYESLGKENVAGGASQYEKGLQALSSLDRIQQINALTEYNKMRDKLLDFLKSFKDRKEVVKEEDIKAFFAAMKPRREPDGVYFCR